MRFLFSIFFLLLVISSLSFAQESETSVEERAMEFMRETIREKMRFDPEEFETIPTVGEIRARLALENEKGEELPSVAGIDQVVSADAAPESEVHAAINPTDSTNIILSPIRLDLLVGGTLLCPIYYTKDFGETWSKSSYLNLPPANNVRLIGGGDPVFAFDANGRAYFTWLNFYTTENFQNIYAGIFWAYSDDGGETWQEAENNFVTIDSGRTQRDLSGFADKQWMAVDKTNSSWRNRLYVAYTEYRISTTTTTTTRIFVRRLTPESMAFVDESVPVSTSSFNFVQFSSVDVDAEGFVHVSFFGEHHTQGWGLWHSVSTNGGESFSTPNLISPVRFGSLRFGASSHRSILGIADNRLYPSPHIAIDPIGSSSESGGGNIYAVWTALGTTKNDGTGYNIYCARSTDNGNTWEEPIIVHSDEDGETDQFYSSVNVNPEGVVAVSWYDKREDGTGRNTDYRVACSFDKGDTFGSSVIVTSEATDFSTIGDLNDDFGIGEYTQVLTTSNYVIPVWADGRSGNGNMDIYVGFVPIDKASLSLDDPVRISQVNRVLSEVDVAPNPATSAESLLRFILQKRSRLKIEVLDITGKKALVVSPGEVFAAGQHQIEIPVSSLTSGEYIVSIRTGEGLVTARLTVVK